MRKVKYDIVGKTFGRLKVLQRVNDYVQYNSRYDMYECQCLCGAKVITRGASLRSGSTRSCGCLRDDLRAKRAEDKPGKSGVPGVAWNEKGKRWYVRIGVNGSRIYLGSYKKLDDAIKARKVAEIKYGYY